MQGRYAEITVPTVVIQGEEDFAGPVYIAVKPMLAELPNCVLIILPRVCHFPPTEALEQVRGVIQRFMDGLQ
jgi:pimeloyl-ACP methyl ester carboxylesterase